MINKIERLNKIIPRSIEISLDEILTNIDRHLTVEHLMDVITENLEISNIASLNKQESELVLNSINSVLSTFLNHEEQLLEYAIDVINERSTQNINN
ncbi:hypothetical protein UA32_11805 [Photobacterium angustum]|uniref:Uncharacterized protein n=1 Tax=Photobacterium angustum TaxID=661 RepID=A0ABX5H1J3_PHOAN|nr:hypothetical protein UA32_11805 [Photobacterium angustum]PSX07101.1 hypothetical protein C0W27_16150 [Photobacterium angustum]